MELQSIVVGGGCFWCLEAIYERLHGVETVESGYTNGHLKNPSYKEVCSGLTGHNEVIKINYNEQIISLAQLLDLFFIFHDPTTLNRQGNDVGTQYRSGIYFANPEQQDEAKNAFERAKELWPNPLVTEIVALDNFYKAEDYHQGYYTNNQQAGYCQFVINPKVNKLRKHYHSLLKSEEKAI